jgi:hypothetical protein
MSAEPGHRRSHYASARADLTLAGRQRVTLRLVVVLAGILAGTLVVALITVSTVEPASGRALLFAGVVGGVLAGILAALRKVLTGHDDTPLAWLILEAVVAGVAGMIGGAVAATVRTILPSSVLASTGNPQWTRPQTFLLGFLVGLALSCATRLRLSSYETVVSGRSDG